MISRKKNKTNDTSVFTGVSWITAPAVVRKALPLAPMLFLVGCLLCLHSNQGLSGSRQREG